MRIPSEIPPGTLHKSGEDYLEAILVLQKTNGQVRSVDLARFMNYSKPSISNAVYVLRRAGYLTVDPDRFIHLTPEGQRQAERILERHQFLTRLLTAIGVEPSIAEADACELEHVISSETFAALKATYHNLS